MSGVRAAKFFILCTLIIVVLAARDRSYLGCFTDKLTRDLTYLKDLKETNSIEACKDLCFTKGFPYAGLQAGSWCACGDSYGKYGGLEDSSCDYECSTGGGLCGGDMKNSVYKSEKSVKYLGCFTDKLARDMTYLKDLKETNSIEACKNLCFTKGFPYAGLQAGSWCACGDSYGKYGGLEDSSCDYECSTGGGLCGGDMKNSVYKSEKSVKYLGCYRDNYSSRDLGHLKQLNMTNSISACIGHCAENGFAYAGLQAGLWCTCGKSYGKYYAVDDDMCNWACPIGSGFCGGPMFNSIYEV